MGCELCPRKCGVDRNHGERGYCQMTSEIVVARVAPHYWEEPCLSGAKGSGTVFFTGCNLHCVYCQNEKISRGKVGKPMTVSELSEAFLSLQNRGCHNINLVTPSHYAEQIAEALRLAKASGLNIPIVYNTSSYECEQTVRKMEGLVDIYLADLKYLSEGLAGKYSHAENYPQTATAAIAEMVRQTGSVCYETEEGTVANATEYPDGALMKRGVIVRHLLLPGQAEEAKRVISYLYETYGDRIAISIMNQYTPMPQVENDPELNRRVTDEEYEEVVNYAIELGVGHGFLQEGETASESFIPDFE